MIIVVDGMGGDFAPGEAVCGAVSAIKEPNIDIIITGKEDIINNELKKYQYDKNRINVLDAKEVITTNEHPVMAVRRKKGFKFS